jgi:hypothetical protein
MIKQTKTLNKFFLAKPNHVGFRCAQPNLRGCSATKIIANAGLYRLVIRERMAVDDIKRHLINHNLHYGHLICRHTPESAES